MVVTPESRAVITAGIEFSGFNPVLRDDPERQLGTITWAMDSFAIRTHKDAYVIRITKGTLPIF